MRRYAPVSDPRPAVPGPMALNYRTADGSPYRGRPTLYGFWSLTCFASAVLLFLLARRITLPGERNDAGVTLAAVTPLFSIVGVAFTVVAMRRRERNVGLVVTALVLNLCYLAVCSAVLILAYVIFGGVSGHDLH